MNVEVRRCEAASDRLLVFEFVNGVRMHLEDDSDHYESMQITFEGDPKQVIISARQVCQHRRSPAEAVCS